jgi:hypothetical protein
MAEEDKADGNIKMEVVFTNLTIKKTRYQKKSSLPTYNNTALEQYDVAEVKVDINTLEHKRDSMAKNAI